MALSVLNQYRAAADDRERACADLMAASGGRASCVGDNKLFRPHKAFVLPRCERRAVPARRWDFAIQAEAHR